MGCLLLLTVGQWRAGHDRASEFRGAAPIGRRFLWGLRPPQKFCVRILRGFPACYAYVDGGWFKTRNGLTELAKTMTVEVAMLLQHDFDKKMCSHVV